jgi:SAM-dependent methyltransferase
MQSLLILGRQPELGLAELESIYGKDKLERVNDKTVIVDVDPCLLAFNRLGGSIKFCKILSTLQTNEWNVVEKFLIDAVPKQSMSMPEGKMKLGLSLIGYKRSPKAIMASGLKLKKAIQATGRSVRLIPNKESELNSAQVIHNGLCSPTGWELVLINDSTKTIIAQTVMVQDIESYTKRDRFRPKRDAKVGMLPPKLAQIIINLAVGLLPEDKLESICDIPEDKPIPQPILNQTILDPFCGTGVVLQEALLMGYGVCGSDLEPRMVDYTKENLVWLNDVYGLDNRENKVEVLDATKAIWSEEFNFIASELFLGQPLSTVPQSEKLNDVVNEANLVVKDFLANLSSQIKSGSRLCIAVPAWQISQNTFKHLPLIDQISDLGYNRLSFEHSGSDKLIYYRSDQIVARELLVLTRK